MEGGGGSCDPQVSDVINIPDLPYYEIAAWDQTAVPVTVNSQVNLACCI